MYLSPACGNGGRGRGEGREVGGRKPDMYEMRVGEGTHREGGLKGVT